MPAKSPTCFSFCSCAKLRPKPVPAASCAAGAGCPARAVLGGVGGTSALASLASLRLRVPAEGGCGGGRGPPGSCSMPFKLWLLAEGGCGGCGGWGGLSGRHSSIYLEEAKAHERGHMNFNLIFSRLCLLQMLLLAPMLNLSGPSLRLSVAGLPSEVPRGPAATCTWP